MWRPGLQLLMAGLLAAAEPLPHPDIPDPYGLGERLALIDHLKQHYGISPKPDSTYEQLAALYWRAKGRQPAMAMGMDGDEAALTRDRLQRLRRELKDRYGVSSSPEEDEPALLRRLAEARAANERAAQAAMRQDAGRPGLSASQSGDIQARMERAGSGIRDFQERSARLGRERQALAGQAKAALERKAALDGSVAATLAERDRWAKAKEEEVRASQVASRATRTSLDAAQAAYREAVEAVNAVVGEVNQLKTDDARLEEEQQRLQVRIAALDKERADDAARLGSAQPQGTPSAAGQPSAWEARLRLAVVLVLVQDRGSGSGFLVSADGLMVTNAHVIGDGQAPMMALWDAEARHPPARLHLVQVAAEDDLALLRAEGDGFTPLVLGEVYELTRPLVAVGFPLAGGISRALGTSPADIVVTRGTLSAIRRQGEQVRWLQHDCRMASGNSGGPLIDQASGLVVGVNAMVLAPGKEGGVGDGLNFAIPSWRIRARFGNLMAGGH